MKGRIKPLSGSLNLCGDEVVEYSSRHSIGNRKLVDSRLKMESRVYVRPVMFSSG